MKKPALVMSAFISLAAANPQFLSAYLKEPDRLRETYDVDDALINKVSRLAKRLESVSAEKPDDLAKIHRILLASDEEGGGFDNAFTDNGFSDSQSTDDSGHDDRHSDDGSRD